MNARTVVGLVLLVVGVVSTLAVHTGRLGYGAIFAGVVVLFRGLVQGATEPSQQGDAPPGE